MPPELDQARALLDSRAWPILNHLESEELLRECPALKAHSSNADVDSNTRRESRLGVTARTQLGPYWLWWRGDRDDWCICRYDGGAGTGSSVSRRTRRLGTGIGGAGPDCPPAAAQDALAAYYLAHEQPKTKPASEVLVETLFVDWTETRLIAPVSAPKGERKLSDPGRYATSITHWVAFFASDRRAGNVMGAHTVADVGVPTLVG